jgi:phage/plasmid-associated DNA primase
MRDIEDRKLWWMNLSTIFLPYQRFETILILHGRTGTGKSTILQPVINAFGKTNSSAVNLEALANMKGRSLGLLEYAMLNVSTELNPTNIIQTGNLKAIFSGEDVWCDQKYQKEDIKRTPASFFFATNHSPKFGRNSDAEMRRIRFIPMNHQIPKAQVNANLKYELEKEAEGILSQAIRGVANTLALHVCPFGGAESRQMWEEASIKANPLDFFIYNKCELKGCIRTTEFEQAYRKFLRPHFSETGINSHVDTMWKEIDKKYLVRKIISMRDDQQKRFLDGISFSRRHLILKKPS